MQWKYNLCITDKTTALITPERKYVPFYIIKCFDFLPYLIMYGIIINRRDLPSENS